jgi:hypothetical protein
LESHIIDKKFAKQRNLLAIGHIYNPMDNKTTPSPYHQKQPNELKHELFYFSRRAYFISHCGIVLKRERISPVSWPHPPSSVPPEFTAAITFIASPFNCTWQIPISLQSWTTVRAAHASVVKGSRNPYLV